jgi:hypothetical protein
MIPDFAIAREDGRKRPYGAREDGRKRPYGAREDGRKRPYGSSGLRALSWASRRSSKITIHFSAICTAAELTKTIAAATYPTACNGR